MANDITLIQPDDWHCHLRDGSYLSRTVADASERFRRVIVMPNLAQPITSLERAKAYYERIMQHVPDDREFVPLMTLYLTETLEPELIRAAKASGLITACKLYPAGSTTLSDYGVANLKKLYPVFSAMQECDIPLLIHGESIAPEADIFDREALFIEQQLVDLGYDFPTLRIVLEHISTHSAVEFVLNTPQNIAATITPHHLLLNRNDLLRGGIRPHYYCLPIVKRAHDQQALIKAATSGNPKFFIGTDSAPHAQSQKETACGCAGIYTAHAAVELYAEIFEQHDALDKLEAFTSINGALFYDLPINSETITLTKSSWHAPKSLTFGDDELIPFKAGERISWKIKPTT